MQLVTFTEEIPYREFLEIKGDAPYIPISAYARDGNEYLLTAILDSLSPISVFYESFALSLGIEDIRSGREVELPFPRRGKGYIHRILLKIPLMEYPVDCDVIFTSDIPLGHYYLGRKDILENVIVGIQDKRRLVLIANEYKN